MCSWCPVSHTESLSPVQAEQQLRNYELNSSSDKQPSFLKPKSHFPALKSLVQQSQNSSFGAVTNF